MNSDRCRHPAILIVFFAVSGLVAGESPEIVREFPDCAGGLAVERVPGGPYGPWGITWADGSLIVGDRAGRRLIRLDDAGRILGEIATPERFDSLAAGPGGRVAFRAGERAFLWRDGGWQTFYLPSAVRPWRGVAFDADGALRAVDAGQRSHPLADPGGGRAFDTGCFQEGIPCGEGFVLLERINAREGRLSVYDAAGRPLTKVPLDPGAAPLAALELIGADAAGKLYLCLHLQLAETPLLLQRVLLILEPDGAEIVRVPLPVTSAARIDHPLTVDPSGRVFALFSLAGRTALVCLGRPTAPEYEPEKIEWPAHLAAGYIPTDFHLPEAPEPHLPDRARNESLHREECLAIAYRYAREEWTAQACNIGVQVCGGRVQTPAWVTVGTHTRIPYDWGGWDSIDSFHRGIADCLKAGDVDTSAVGTCGVGVDCSGFVSRCWKTSQKYGTSTLPGISTQISADSMRPGDVFNDAGSHVILFVRRNEDGSCACIESHGGAWCVEETFYSAPPAGYTPRRYDQMLEGHLSGTGTPGDPFLIPFLPYQDSWTTTGSASDILDFYSCAPGTDESGPEVVYRLDLLHWADLTAAVTDGTGVDVDVQILTAPAADACLARADTIATAPGLAPGTYFLTADSWVDSGGTVYDGAYTLFAAASWPQGIGTFANPIRIDAFPFQHAGTTHNADSDSLDTYACAPSVREDGPEVIYTFTTTTPGDLGVSVANGEDADIDIHLLDGPDALQCLARAHLAFAYPDLPAGTYWIVADSWTSSGGVEYPGDYELTVDFVPDVPPDADGDGIPDAEDPEPLVRHGDVNDDGEVDAGDMLRLAQHLAGNLAAGQGGFDHPACADLNLDDALQALDLAAYAAHLCGHLPAIPF